MGTLERAINAEEAPAYALDLDLVEIGALSAMERDAALGVLSRGMRDNPLHVRVFGNDPDVREQRLAAMFGASFAVMGLHEQMLVARDVRGRILAVCGMTPPGTDSTPAAAHHAAPDGDGTGRCLSDDSLAQGLDRPRSKGAPLALGSAGR